MLGEVAPDEPYEASIAREGEDQVVDLVSDDEADIIVETLKGIADVGESVPVTAPNIDEFVAEMEEVASSEKPTKDTRPPGPRDDVAYVDVSGKKD